jgi:crotonobetainyl-CoA:carnitine CoA-transferase CaiB-like acyl-CoA transferase
VSVSALPLEGVKVIDLSAMLAGPFASMVLADLGADVVKVEPPAGDFTRALGPFTTDDETRAYGGYFQSVNRNKRGIVLDLQTAEGVQQLERLVAGADVLIENFRNGVMNRLGIPYERLAEINPRLVYACIRGFGDHRTGRSPYVDWPAYDLTAQAISGVMAGTGEPDGPPAKVGPGIGDTVPALFSVAGLLAALVRADRTGRGGFVDVAMYDAMLAISERQIYQYSYTGEEPRRHGAIHPLLSPFDLLRCRDGWVTIAAPGDGHWRVLCELISISEFVEDSRTATASDRVRNRQFVHDLLESWTSTRSKHEIVELLGGRVPVGPVNTVRDIYDDPHVAVRGMIAPVDQPNGARSVRVAGRPIKFLGVSEPPLRRAPLLGEHTDQVLAELDAHAVPDSDSETDRSLHPIPTPQEKHT